MKPEDIADIIQQLPKFDFERAAGVPNFGESLVRGDRILRKTGEDRYDSVDLANGETIDGYVDMRSSSVSEQIYIFRFANEWLKRIELIVDNSLFTETEMVADFTRYLVAWLGYSLLCETTTCVLIDNDLHSLHKAEAPMMREVADMKSGACDQSRLLALTDPAGESLHPPHGTIVVLHALTDHAFLNLMIQQCAARSQSVLLLGVDSAYRMSHCQRVELLDKSGNRFSGTPKSPEHLRQHFLETQRICRSRRVAFECFFPADAKEGVVDMAERFDAMV